MSQGEVTDALDHAAVEADGNAVFLRFVTITNGEARYTMTKEQAFALGSALIRKSGHRATE